MQIRGSCIAIIPWPNGKALLSGGKDWEFESPWNRSFLRSASLFLLRLMALIFCGE